MFAGILLSDIVVDVWRSRCRIHLPHPWSQEQDLEPVHVVDVGTGYSTVVGVVYEGVLREDAMRSVELSVAAIPLQSAPSQLAPTVPMVNQVVPESSKHIAVFHVNIS